MTTKEMQNEINEIISKLSWSQYRLADVLYTAKYDDDGNVEDKNGKTDKDRCYEKLKKELTRSSTKPALLESYLQIICNDREFEKLDCVKPFYVKHDDLNSTVESGLK